MKKITERIVHYTALIVISAAAVWVMRQMSQRGEVAAVAKPEIRPLAPVASPKAPVAIAAVAPELCDITATFSGKIRAWETYEVGFEAPGRVAQLGTNASGELLDEGDRVEAGQLLAMLDNRVLVARRSEASAQVEQAESDLTRAQQSRRTNPNAIPENELQQLITNVALAQAQLAVASKNLEDASLRAPVSATISRRMVKPGETVGANEMAFELVENDRVLLILNVPESRIRELQMRMKTTGRLGGPRNVGHPGEDSGFHALVRPEGKDVYGNPWDELDGRVFHIAEIADPSTSLFEVEVELPNDNRILRPGMVATARLVTDQIEGYKVPAISVIYRQNSAYIFAVEPESADMELLYWNVGEVTLHRARRLALTTWAEEDGHVVVPLNTMNLENVITRGHLRLADGQLVRVVEHQQTSNDGPTVASDRVADRNNNR